MGEAMDYITKGRHLAIDFWGVSFERLNDRDSLQKHLQYSLQKNGVHVLSCQSKQFTPHGVTVLIMLSESHASIHTYPEKGYAALDCYTCGDQMDPMMIVHDMIEQLRPKQVYAKRLYRGDGPIEVESVDVPMNHLIG